MSFSSSIINKVILIIFLSFLGFIVFTLFRPLPVNEITIIEIEEGDGLYKVINRLSEQRLIKRPLIVKGYVKFLRSSEDIKAGEYSISESDNLFKFIQKISEGSFYYYQIRLREGATTDELIDLFKNTTALKNDANCEDKKMLESRMSEYVSGKIFQYRYGFCMFCDYDDYIGDEPYEEIKSLEGMFSPDTYNFTKDDTCIDILKEATNIQWYRFLDMWEEMPGCYHGTLRNYKGKLGNCPHGLTINNLYEAIILASIIEKEGVEKKKIAGVFLRRLKLRMKLQSDPTIIYALGDRYDGDIRRSHIKMKHPYNTYHIKGLPPTPIGLVSESSLEAVFNSEEGTSLYFVAKGDGSHHFSDTLKEHNQAVRKYQIDKQ